MRTSSDRVERKAISDWSSTWPGIKAKNDGGLKVKQGILARKKKLILASKLVNA